MSDEVFLPAIEYLKKKGVDYADLRSEHEDRERIQVKNGEVQLVSRGEDQGFGIRVLANGSWGFAASPIISEEKAVEILESLEDSDPDDFKRLAQTHSIGVEASRGGEMGIFALGQLPDEMEKAIFVLKEGNISPVLESSYGFHIFRLDARYEPELISPDQAADSIEVKILGQKVKDRIAQHIANLKNSLEWEFYTQNLYFSYQRISDD